MRTGQLFRVGSPHRQEALVKDPRNLEPGKRHQQEALVRDLGKIEGENRYLRMLMVTKSPLLRLPAERRHLQEVLVRDPKSPEVGKLHRQEVLVRGLRGLEVENICITRSMVMKNPL
jgi:hypothetical protein